MVSQEVNSNVVGLGLYVNSTLTRIGDAELGSVECTSIVMRRSEGRWDTKQRHDHVELASVRPIS